MLSTQMMLLAERNQWRTNAEEQTVFGEFNGYLFTGLEGKGFKAFITPLAGINYDALQSLLSYLTKNTKTLNLLNFDVSDNFLCVRAREGLFPLSAAKMEYLLAQISGLLSLSELPVDACAVCGEPAVKRGLYFGLFCHLHPECKDREPVDFTVSGPVDDTAGTNPPAGESASTAGGSDAGAAE
jgi:hypothetical protein